MLLSSFKLAGYKVFGDVVELNMTPQTKNLTYLADNLIVQNKNNRSTKNLKCSIIYGGNNTGKSSLLDGLMSMKRIFTDGDASNFATNIDRNFCYEFDNIIRFEVEFLDGLKSITYGMDIDEEGNFGEYLFSDDLLLFSRGLNEDSIDGNWRENESFRSRIEDLPSNKLIVPYLLEYTKMSSYYSELSALSIFFEKIHFVDNRRNTYNPTKFIEFCQNQEKMSILNTLISSTGLFLEKRGILSEEELANTPYYQALFNPKDAQKLDNIDQSKESFKMLSDMLRITSYYKDKNGSVISKPSVFFDSVGTNKFISLAINIIDALFEGHILLIDEFDSSLHYKLTRALVIFMQSKANKSAQFILTSHDVKLLTPKLFRKDQINFIHRDDCAVEIISLDEYKANSKSDIRSDSNFETLYTKDKIVPLPTTDIYEVIKAFNNG